MAVTDDEHTKYSNKQMSLQEISSDSANSIKSSLSNRIEDEEEAAKDQQEAYLYGLLGMSQKKSAASGGLDDTGSMQGSDMQESLQGSLPGDEKSWKTMDSVHSRCSSGHILNNSDDSFNYNDSCASFASFDDSGSDLHDSIDEIKDAFTDLDETPSVPSIPSPARRTGLMKSSSMRFQRAPSFRGTLSLIEEKDIPLE